MNVLHAVWNGTKEKALDLWVESSSLASAAGTKQLSKGPVRHPQCVSRAALPEVLQSVIPDKILKKASFTTEILRLPGRRKPHSLSDGGDSVPDSSTGFWKVDALRFLPPSLLQMTESISNDPSTRMAPSLEFILAALEISRVFVSKGWFLPVFRRAENRKKLFTRWQIAIPEAGETLFRRLCAAAPPALMIDKQNPGEESLEIRELLNVFVDALIRKNLPLKGPWFASLEEQWLRSLTENASFFDSRPVEGPEEELAAFQSAIEKWLGNSSRESDFRLCLKLKEPKGRQEHWTLEFYLQAKEDHSVRIPASEVWTKKYSLTGIWKDKLGDGQKTLLEALGTAALIYPLLTRCLKAREPEELTLSSDEAHEFLCRSVLMLKAKKIGVEVPAWWYSKEKNFSCRLVLRPDTKAAAVSGMETLLKYDYEIALGDQTLSLDEFEQLVGEKKALVRVRGRWGELRHREIENARMFFQKKNKSDEMPQKMTAAAALRLGLEGEISELGLAVRDIRAEGWTEALIRGLSSSGSFEWMEVPDGFQGTLRPYQLRGASWLYFLSSMGFGACLADDMGLGKTIQSLALLLKAKSDDPKMTEPSLLICPMSVAGNWCREAARFAPGLKVLIHHGEDRKSGEAFLKNCAEYDLVITTYSLLARDRETLQRRVWNFLFLDEAQNIKNSEARQTQAAKKLKARARVALTGTPVENRLTELWSILDFLNPGYLGTEEDFRARFQKPIEKRHDKEKVEAIRRLSSPFILRRLKTDKSIIRDLPEKMEMKTYCNLTKEQAALYAAALRECMAKIEQAEGIQRKGLIFSALIQLKQICNHPVQYLGDKGELSSRSGKLNRLREMMEEALSEGDRILVFTQYKEMGDLLCRDIRESLGTDTFFLHGGVSLRERDEMVDCFQKGAGAPVFVLSTRAGGTGLNLTAANHVFHFDRWWNPAVENQATDRAYRIGQTRNVQVHKLICLGTLEEKIDKMIERKSALAEAVVSSGENFITELSMDELNDILTLEKDAVGE